MTDRTNRPSMASSDRGAVTDLDLLGYADGLLTADPHRRETVERFLREHPEEARRVADIQEQNQALRQLGEEWLYAPIPDRLLDTLEAEGSPVRRRAAVRATAVAAMVAAAALGGWVLGARGPETSALAEFAESALSNHGRYGIDAVSMDRTSTELQGMAPLNWLTRRMSVRVQLPDLTAQGYALIAKERVALSGEPVVRLGYRHRDGRPVNIYLRPRWDDRPAAVARAEKDGVRALNWLDGPLAVAMTTDAGVAPDEEDSLVSAVRRAISEASVARPVPRDAASQTAPRVRPLTSTIDRLDAPVARGRADPGLRTN